MNDDLDQPSENVRIKLDNVTIVNSMDVDYGTYHFVVNSAMLQNDGVLTVNLNVLSGDFWFNGSELDVSANRTAAVPEPPPWPCSAPVSSAWACCPPQEGLREDTVRFPWTSTFL